MLKIILAILFSWHKIFIQPAGLRNCRGRPPCLPDDFTEKEFLSLKSQIVVSSPGLLQNNTARGMLRSKRDKVVELVEQGTLV
jgi:hypothetical protein